MASGKHFGRHPQGGGLEIEEDCVCCGSARACPLSDSVEVYARSYVAMIFFKDMGKGKAGGGIGVRQSVLDWPEELAI